MDSDRSETSLARRSGIKKVHETSPRKTENIVNDGGNFWEIWDKSLESGTPINMMADRFVDSGIPIFSRACGVEIARGTSPYASKIYSKDLQIYSSSEQFLTTIRNDGSRDNLRQLGLDSSEPALIDHGFSPVIDAKRKEEGNSYNVVLNVSEDMKDILYRGFPNKILFVSGLAKVLSRFASKLETRFQIVAHVPSNVAIGS